jgi:hypothetical protein
MGCKESKFEQWLNKTVNEPLLEYVIPPWVTPNSISLINGVACWGAFMCSYLAWELGKRRREIHENACTTGLRRRH